MELGYKTNSGIWGKIKGLLSNQTDLAETLSAKADLVAGKVPSTQLPSYVDDVIEVANYASLPATGETSKIYVTIDNNFAYRWTGSVYVKVSDFDLAANIHAAESKTTPVDADEFGFWDSVSGLLRKFSWANLKATLKTYFDTLYPTISISRVSVTGTDSLESSDNGKVIEFSSTSNFTFTLDQMYDGFNCTLVNINTGDVTIAAGSGVTIRHESANRKLTTQYR